MKGSNSILIKNGTVATLGEKNQILEDFDLLIENGEIKKIAKKISVGEPGCGVKVISARNKLVLPGFINAHTHYYSSFACGFNKAASSANFLEVLENLWWRLDKELLLEDCYYSALVANIDAIKKGTTTLIDHHASPNAITGSLKKISEAVLFAGVRASLCYEVSDRDGKKIKDTGIEENLNFIKALQARPNPMLSAIFGLHASFTLSDETLSMVAKKNEADKVGFHIHCAEDMADQKNCVDKHKKRVVERLASHGILGSKTILAHGVFLEEEELDLIAKSQSAVVHNPQSNMNNAVGVANILKMRERGILVGLGTDAMTTNMLEELRSAIWVQRLQQKNPSSAFSECCDLLVKNNRKIAQRYWPALSSNSFELKKGAPADVIIVDYNPATLLNADNFYGHLVFGAAQATVDTTIVSGKILMQDKKLSGLDEEQIKEEARRVSSLLWER